MSRVYFHSEHGTAELRGSERAYAGVMCSDLLAAVLRVDSQEDFSRRLSPLRRVIGGYPRTAEHGAAFQRALRLYLGGMSDGYFLVDGREHSVFSVGLNTAYVMGSDPVKLLARMHGQCEIHAYVEGPNRAWLAGIIEQGRAAGIMRAEQGWEEVAALLRERDDGPVVTSYSVCEQFPNGHVAQFEYPEDENGENDWEAWYELSEDERWARGIAGLRAGSMGRGLELKPDNWAAFHFNSGMNGFLVQAYADSLVNDE